MTTRMPPSRDRVDVPPESELAVTAALPRGFNAKPAKHPTLSLEDYYQVLDQYAHDARSPHCVIAEFAALIRDGVIGDEPDELAETLDIIRTRVAELQLDVDILLMIAKLASGRIEVHSRSFRAADVVGKSVSRLQSSFRIRNVTVRTAVDPKAPRAQGDAALAQMVLLNLLWSIVRAAPSPSDVCVAADQSDPKLLTFRVTGSAMRRSDLAPRGLAAQARMAAEVRQSPRHRIDLALGLAWDVARLLRGKITCNDDSIEPPTVEFSLPAHD